mgnify:FL=1
MAGVKSEGLSPLARGKQILPGLQMVDAGPIPAGAGETPSAPSVARWRRAYPRWRGGNRHGELRIEGVQGLSPLARGKHPLGVFVGEELGPIPAGAGETLQFARASFSKGAYPRWRGGNSFEPAATTAPGGLSPLARGKRRAL